MPMPMPMPMCIPHHCNITLRFLRCAVIASEVKEGSLACDGRAKEDPKEQYIRCFVPFMGYTNASPKAARSEPLRFIRELRDQQHNDQTTPSSPTIFSCFMNLT